MSSQNTDRQVRRGRGGVVPFIRRALGGTLGLAAALLALVAWRALAAHGGTPDPTDPGTHLGHGALIVDSAMLVLLVVMNWCFQKVYWTGWIAHHHVRRRQLAVGVVTFALPYKKMLVATGILLSAVLLVMVGQEVQELQQAGWLRTTAIAGLHLPGWMGLWFSLVANWQTVIAQALAAGIVIGSYVAAERRIHHRSEIQATPNEVQTAARGVKLAVDAADNGGYVIDLSTVLDGRRLPEGAITGVQPYRSAYARQSQVGHRYGRAALAGRRSARAGHA
jgi:hypothetical protein